MILFLQYTITDPRIFTLEKSGQLLKPSWPSPRPFNEFVRGTGSIVERNKKGLDNWVGENFVCRIKSSLKFSDENKFTSGTSIKNISKHLYANKNYVLTKYEFVFDLKLPTGDSKLGYDFVKTIIEEFLNFKINIKFKGAESCVSVAQLPSKLLDFHYQNTTRTNLITTLIGRDYLLKCTPQLYFYLENSEKAVKIDRNFKQIAKIPNFATLYGAWHNHKNNPFRIWIHERNKKSIRFAKNRETRIMIMRLHSEYECLNNIFLSISSGVLDVGKDRTISDMLQDYFNNAIRNFLYESSDLSYNLWSRNYFDYFQKVYAKASPGEMKLIQDKINSFNFRVNIRNKTNTYLIQHFTMNKYNNKNSTIVSQGDNNHIENNQITQNVNTSNSQLDFDALAIELSKIIEHAQSEASNTDERKQILALSEAHDSAIQKDSGKLLNALKSCGKFVLDIANKMTASILVELLKNPQAFS